MDNNELTHYGVPGMKWGRRKSISGQKSNLKISSVKNNKQTSKGLKAAAITLSVIGPLAVTAVGVRAIAMRAARKYTIIGMFGK